MESFTQFSDMLLKFHKPVLVSVLSMNLLENKHFCKSIRIKQWLSVNDKSLYNGHGQRPDESFCVLVYSVMSNSLACIPPGSSVRGTFQARILEWVLIFSFRESFWPRTEPTSPVLQMNSLSIEPPGKP